MSDSTVAPGAPVARAETTRERRLRIQRKQTAATQYVSMTIDGELLEAVLVCPDLKTRRDGFKAFKDDPQKQDIAAMIQCAFEVGEKTDDGKYLPSNVKLYETHDMDVLLQDPSGGWVDTLCRAYGALLLESVKSTQEEAKK